jgi:hypothetical protein
MQRTTATETTQWAAWMPLFILPAVAILARDRLPPWGFMWALSFAIFAGLKWLTWWRARASTPHPAWRSAAYLLAWPGMDAETFLASNPRVPRPPLGQWLWAVAKTALGIVLLWVVARRMHPLGKMAQGWIGLLGLIFLLHFGSFHLIALFWQRTGIAAEPIMSNPALSTSLSEFWGKRWNLGFRQLAHDLVFQPLHKWFGVAGASFAVFVASGLLHDLVISLPARGGYGLPTIYFVVQGLGVAVERSTIGRRFGLRQGARGWLFLLVVTAGPVYWLFHPPFVQHVILPFMHAIHSL